MKTASPSDGVQDLDPALGKPLSIATSEFDRDPLGREPLGRRIATVIARDIIYGRLRAHENLNQEDLCRRFGISRMPVRDALLALAAAGYLARGVGNRLTVAPLTAQDLEDIFGLEATLSGLIAGRAAERRESDEVTKLGVLHELMRSAATNNDGKLMSQLNREFHGLIGEMARSAPLVAAYQNTTIHIGWEYYQDEPSRMGIGCKEHARILQCIADQDHKKANRLMVAHLTRAQKYRHQPAGSSAADGDVSLDRVGR